MKNLYPLKFESILKEKIWGGTSLVKKYHKKGNPSAHYGESWELSAIADNLSVIKNGFLAGNNIEELIEVYMGDLIGDAVYEKFGNEFPLLIKIIEANTDLSIQVHPDNALAKERHNAYGKTEMWYILEAAEGAKIYSGFNKPINREEYLKAVADNNLVSLMNIDMSHPGDVFFTPSGRVHAIGTGNILVEIQQTSDITYRIFDWNRVDENGKSRELHTELAADAIDYDSAGSNKKSGNQTINTTNTLVDCEFFTTNLLWINKPTPKNYFLLDTFIVYICLKGNFKICWDDNTFDVAMGETVLLPATIKNVILEPDNEAKIIEVYIRQ